MIGETRKIRNTEMLNRLVFLCTSISFMRFNLLGCCLINLNRNLYEFKQRKQYFLI